MPNFKQQFVKQVLADEGKRYLKNQGIEMHKRLHFHTNRLFTDRSAKTESANDMDGSLVITHTAYERFLDIKRMTRSSKTNKLKQSRVRIHNRFVFGHYFSIANRLMTELTESARAAIIADLNSLDNG
jgi:hypothetical protein